MRHVICIMRETSRHIPYAHTSHLNYFRCDAIVQAYGYTPLHHLPKFNLNTKSTMQCV